MKFWMVLDSRDGSSCKQRHYDSKLAEAEAERLAEKEGRAFYVLEATLCCQPMPRTVWTDMRKETKQ